MKSVFLVKTVLAWNVISLNQRNVVIAPLDQPFTKIQTLTVKLVDVEMDNTLMGSFVALVQDHVRLAQINILAVLVTLDMENTILRTQTICVTKTVVMTNILILSANPVNHVMFHVVHVKAQVQTSA